MFSLLGPGPFSAHVLCIIICIRIFLFNSDVTSMNVFRYQQEGATTIFHDIELRCFLKKYYGANDNENPKQFESSER